MIPMLITLFVFYVIYLHPIVKDFFGGYQSKYDTIMDSYIDLELNRRYKYKKNTKVG